MSPEHININQSIYRETIEDLRAKIESKHGSVKNFCEINGIDNFNLYRIFSKNSKREMSVGMFARIVTGLGVKGLENVERSDLSLKSYLEIDNNAILKSILLIKFS